MEGRGHGEDGEEVIRKGGNKVTINGSLKIRNIYPVSRSLESVTIWGKESF